jgi:hypothetical protein
MPGVVPGPTDDVYFDENSGFTAPGQRITVDVVANCRNITFSGLSVLPEIWSNNRYSLNIYGSSVWQEGMVVKVYNIYYRNTETAKTIKSNGVAFGVNVFLEETSTVELMDDLTVMSNFTLSAGTWKTNGFTVKLGYLYANKTGMGPVPRTLELGSSDIYIGRPGRSGAVFNTGMAQCTVNAGTSHIHFVSDYYNTSYGLAGYNGQRFHDVTFESPKSVSAPIKGDLTFNRVEFKGGGYISGNSTFNELLLSPGGLYRVVSGKAVTVKDKLSGGRRLFGMDDYPQRDAWQQGDLCGGRRYRKHYRGGDQGY